MLILKIMLAQMLVLADLIFPRLNRKFVVLFIAAAGVQVAQAQIDATKPVVGIAAHLWGLSHKDIDAQLDLMAAGKFKMVRWEAPWKVVEQEKGKFQIPDNWDYLVERMQAKGMESLLVLDYGNKFYDNGDKPVSNAAVEGFATYAAYVAKHFAGRVKYYEVWNEWNSRIGNTNRGRSEDYAALLKRTYASIKSSDSAAQVVGGGFSSSSNDSIVNYGTKEATLEVLLSQGIGQYCDAMAIHPYVVYRDGSTRSLAGFQDLMNKVVQRIRRTPGLEKKPIFITEIGWSTAKDSPRGVTEDQQAEYLNNAIDLAGQLGISHVIVYELRDGNKDASDTEGNFGIMRFNFSPKPAYQKLRSRQ